jgi:hypothetical protein
MPIMIARFRCLAGRPAAASPMTMALSPASTKSIMTTWIKVATALCAGSMSQPMRSVMFDPIQNSGPERSQGPHVIGEQRQADRKHPQSRNRQKPKNAANGQQ